MKHGGVRRSAGGRDIIPSAYEHVFVKRTEAARAIDSRTAVNRRADTSSFSRTVLSRLEPGKCGEPALAAGGAVAPLSPAPLGEDAAAESRSMSCINRCTTGSAAAAPPRNSTGSKPANSGLARSSWYTCVAVGETIDGVKPVCGAWGNTRATETPLSRT